MKNIVGNRYTMKNNVMSYEPIFSETDPLQSVHHPAILVIGKGERFAGGTLDYALGVAERLGADLLAVSINTFSEDDDAGLGRALRFATSSAESTTGMRTKAQSKGLAFRHLCRKGKVSQVISDLLHEQKHISFILAEEDIPIDAIAPQLPVPMFAIRGTGVQGGEATKDTMVQGTRTLGTITRNHDNKGVYAMATDTTKQQARPKALLFGVLTASLYAAVFLNSTLVMKYFTKGGLYNILPVLTVFAVSYVHGSFASNVWTALGINASRKTPSATKEAPARQTQRPRPRMNA